MKLSRASSGRGRAHSATKPLGDSKADGDHGDAQASPQRVFLKLFSGCVIRCSRVRFDEFEFAGLIPASGKCRGDGFAQLAHCFPDEWIFECELSVPGTYARIREVRADESEGSDALVRVFESDEAGRSPNGTEQKSVLLTADHHVFWIYEVHL